MFCTSERRRCTRKMRFSALSTVSISITEVTTKPAMPMAVRRAAFCEKELICSITVSTAGVSGSTFSRMKSCREPIHSSNTGKAVVTASATVNSGTSESSVV